VVVHYFYPIFSLLRMVGTRPLFQQTPNLVLLNNALTQTNWDGPALTVDNWREVVFARLESIVWEQAIDDVRPFLAATKDLALLTCENVLQLLIFHR